MKRVLTAVVLVPLVLLVVFRAPLWLFALVVVLVAALAMHEYLKIANGNGVEPVSWPAYVTALLLILVAFGNADFSLIVRYPWLRALLQGWFVLLGAALIFGIPIVFRRDMRMSLAASALSAFGVLYVAAPLASLVLLRRDTLGQVFLVFALFSVWAGDTAAFYVGRTLGRHKLAPVVSPGKTWEGAVASVIASVAVSFLIFRYAEQIERLFTQPKISFYTPLSGGLHLSVANVIAVGVVTNIAAQLGDLFESAIKRGAQVKDSGSLLPGHGGILDRIDALLFAIPAVWYYAFFHSYFFESQ